MATTQTQARSPRTPREYADWWTHASDEEIDGRPTPEEYAKSYTQRNEATAPKAAPKASTKSTSGAQASRATWALGMALLIFGGIGWIFGGMFTLDGWISWVNGILTIVRIPLSLPAATGLWRLLFIPLAVIYSRVETHHRPVWRDEDKQWHFEQPLFWVGFILITLTDIGSTAVGLQFTDAGAWGALQPTVTWLVGSGVRIGAVATVLTFAPEWLILGGIWLLKR